MSQIQSILRGHWRSACALAGISFIDPAAPVQVVLDQIKASSMIITEAMHGAIVADALRVPWVPILPFDIKHHMKWFDWAEALDIKLSPRRLAPSSSREVWVLWKDRDTIKLQNARGLLKQTMRIADAGLTAAAAATLFRVARSEPALSSDPALSRALDRLQSSANTILRDYLV